MQALHEIYIYMEKFFLTSKLEALVAWLPERIKAVLIATIKHTHWHNQYSMKNFLSNDSHLFQFLLFIGIFCMLNKFCDHCGSFMCSKSSFFVCVCVNLIPTISYFWKCTNNFFYSSLYTVISKITQCV